MTSVIRNLMDQWYTRSAELSSISIDEDPDTYRSVLFELISIEQEIQHITEEEDSNA